MANLCRHAYIKQKSLYSYMYSPPIMSKQTTTTLLYTCAQSHTHDPHKLLHISSKPIVTKHVFCHLQTQIHSAEQPRPHTHTKDPGAKELCVRSTSHAGKTSGKELCSSKLLLNELIRHWYAKSCYKEREWEAAEKRKDGRWGGPSPVKYGPISLKAKNSISREP